MKRRGSATIFVIITIVILVIGGASYFIFSGNGEGGSSESVKLPSGKKISSATFTDDGLCHNSDYSTEYFSERDYIRLTSESKEKLKDALIEGGITELGGISNLVCLTYLKLDWFARYDEEPDDVTPLSNLVNLEVLSLEGWLDLEDASPLGKLTKLKTLILSGSSGSYNDVSDISFMSELKDLEWLVLAFSEVSDLSPLKDLKKLEHLSLDGAENVKDVSALEGIDSLKRAILYGVDISDEECKAFEAKRPNVEVFCDYRFDY
jgi:hypothetical protein